MDYSAGGLPIGLTAQIANLAALFGGGPLLRIPAYQRPYTWTASEVLALLTDLLLAFQRRAPYYFVGHIVLVRCDRGDFEVADGQQRLATLTMVLAYARDHLPARSEALQGLITVDGAAEALPRLRLRRADERFFLEYVQVPGGLTRMRAPSDGRSDSQTLICQAVETIEETLATLDLETLDQFIRFIARCATFDVMIADERGGAATIFPTMNNRGRSLSGPDILKQELLERSGLADAQADEAALLWEGLEDRLGRNAFSQLVGEILPIIFNGEQLRAPGDLNALRAAIQKRGPPKVFLTELLPRYGAALVELRQAAVKAGALSADVNRRIRRLLTLPETLWLAPAVAFLADHRTTPQRTLRFFKALEAMGLASYLNALRSDRKERRFARILQSMGEDQRLFGAQQLALSQAEHDALLGRINVQKRGESGHRRVVVLWLNAALPGGESLGLDDDATVEHILPTNPNADWLRAFPIKDQRRELCDILGNFVLIGAAKNDRLGNRSFSIKMKEYFAEDGEPIFALTRDIKGATEWTPEMIRARHERLVRILAEDLGLI